VNAIDRAKLIRRPDMRGERNGRAKLDEFAARCIKYAEGKHEDIAIAWNISRAVVGKIKQGKLWRHIQ
jgi:hypothetical protein